MNFGRKGEYALRALVHLAQSVKRCRAREISQDQNVPYDFMAKILQELKSRGFVRSARGKGGGYALARPPEQIRLMEVLQALECDGWLHHCMYGFAGCDDANPCPMHQDWKAIRSQVEIFLNRRTIGDLAQSVGGEKPPLEWLGGAPAYPVPAVIRRAGKATGEPQ